MIYELSAHLIRVVLSLNIPFVYVRKFSAGHPFFSLCMASLKNLLPLQLDAEILRVSGMIPNQGFGEFEGVRHGSPSSMTSPNIMSNFSGAGGSSGWSSLLQEVCGFSD